MALPSPSAAFPAMTGSPPPPVHHESSGVILSGSMNWDPVRKRLLGTDLNDALAAATELREGIEIVHTVEFPLMLSALLPAFSTILGHRTSPSPDTSTVQHKLRNVVLEVMSRMPSNEILRPHAPHLVAVALDILNRDYEENALIASRIIFDLYKVYRSLPQDYVQPYLDFVQNAYRSLQASVQRNFVYPALAAGQPPENPNKAGDVLEMALEDSKTAVLTPGKNPTASERSPAVKSASPAAVATPTGGSTLASPSMGKLPTTPVPRLSPRSNSSFRVLTECPLVVMLMFQLYPKFLRGNIPVLINVMMEALALRAPPIQSITQGNQTLDANGKRLYFSRCRELVAAQAKTLSFLTYLLRGFSNDLKPYEDRLATNVVALMSTCPREFISTRKELLVATRHLLNSEFRNGFFRHVDALLDERVLIGSHHRYSEQTVLRPLGYTTLSDLVHHVRARLSLPQVSRVVSMFSRVLHDSSMTLPISTQYTAVRTLLSVVDIVYHNKDRNAQFGRDILVRILKTLVDKLAALQCCRKQSSDPATPTEAAESYSCVSQKESIREADTTMNLHISQIELPAGNDPKDSLRDLKSMVRAIIVGHKTLIWYINNYRSQREKDKVENAPPVPGSNEEVASALLKITHTERALIDKYIHLAFPCMKWLKDDDSGKANHDRHVSDQYRDALTYFAAAFTTLEPYDLRRILGGRLNLLVDAIMDEPTAIVVPRHLLAANASTSFEFCSLLLEFLVERMDDLATCSATDIKFIPPTPTNENDEIARLQKLSAEPPTCSEEKKRLRSSAHLQLFERVLKSLSSYPENERCLRPYLKRIVSTCLRTSLEKAECRMDNYCILLRYVFRSISAGKFEESYRELLPLIPTVLNGLYRVFRSTDAPAMHHAIIELLLTIPARLSSLLPHMNLLLRIIISALQSNSGDLANLGLRTLEFWVDNLNPEFLFPELSKRTDLFVQLMSALSTHLRPAPYPYGLLTLRLLGKLGGKNRLVLREPIDVRDPSFFNECKDQLELQCHWTVVEDNERQEGVKATKDTIEQTPKVELDTFHLPLPIERSVEMLKRFVGRSVPSETNSHSNHPASNSLQEWKDSEKLWSIEIEDTDLLPYCLNVVEETQQNQVDAALTVLRSALTTVLEVDFGDSQSAESPGDAKNALAASSKMPSLNHQLELVSFGLLLGCAIDSVSKESLVFAKGLLTNVFMVVRGHHQSFTRIDANGCSLHITSADDEHPSSDNVSKDNAPWYDLFEEELGSVKPFGYFELKAPLDNKANPLVINKSLTELLAQRSPHPRAVGLDLVKHILSLPRQLVPSGGAPSAQSIASTPDRGTLIYFESLLDAMCEKCITVDWNRRDGLYDAICMVLEALGLEWCQRYEIELMNVALLSLKTIPKELSMATVRAFRFLIRVCCHLYGKPDELELGDDHFVFDVFTRPGGSKDDKTKEKEQPKKVKPASLTSPCEAVVQVLISEMASTKQMVRVAARYIVKRYLIDVVTPEKSLEVFKRQLHLVTRVLFSRSLRLLPLPEQVGAVEALAFIVDQVPLLLPITDQHLLAFLSELLKMSSVADGEMTDSNLVGNVVDKNGYAVPPTEAATSPVGNRSDSPASSLFLRRDCILQFRGSKLVIPQELSSGVQLRVSAICLLRAVIRGHPNTFFDAESSAPVGNVRPHVISLLFRSLVSVPVRAVTAAHDALRDVLTLSVVSEGGKSKSRLRKELLQTCIRPVLLNLRDYTRLSVPLIRGLSRLLSLLSSWFNKTLGEKLLDHLQKWTDPNGIRSQKIWKEGEEPEVAAAVINLFVLLPHASHFVEPLVKTTIKLEACLPAYKSVHVQSPYRKPLARYLNKHCHYTVDFFFQRLKTPLYSEIFQDLIRLPESKALREHLSGRQCSVSLLNTCFERPLAIIRSEKVASSAASPGPSPSKPGSSPSTSELFILHGLQVLSEPPGKKEASLRQDVDVKKKKLHILQQEVTRTKEVLHSKTTATKSAVPPSEIEESKRQLIIAKAAYDRGAKDFNKSKQRYAAEMQLKANQRSPQLDNKTTRPMTIETLELQYQGFRVVETLLSTNADYLNNHTDVLRAFRWLWRSKGRYLRLQHEASVPPRYHGESKLIASFLVDYSRQSPGDVDLLFELIRIFLQSSSSDFSFVRNFLRKAVSWLSVEQKQQIIQRFFALLAGESTEEIKTLSVQLVVYPMLETSFGDVESKQRTHDALTSDREAENPESVDRPNAVVDASIARRFVTEVLFTRGSPISCSDRLKVELLRLASLLLEHVPILMEGLSKDLIKFTWALLKSDDTSCKSWANLVLCRHISVLETPSRIVSQVYNTLLRSHQQEGKELVRTSLDLLVPSLPIRLSWIELKKAMEHTNRIMFDEGNSIPQLAHIWNTIVNHRVVFQSNRHQFVRYMVNSLNRLGLPPSCPPENRALAVSIVELVMEWDNEERTAKAPQRQTTAGSPVGTKRSAEELVANEDTSHTNKKWRTASGAPAKTENSKLRDSPSLLDKSMVDTIVNFLVRLKILLADPKTETGLSSMEPRLPALLRKLASTWKECLIRPVYLEKVVAMCKDHNSVDKKTPKSPEKGRQRSMKATGKSKGYQAVAGKKTEDSAQLVSPLLSACLDVFSVLADEAPKNRFLTDNSSQLSEILQASFEFARHKEEDQLREKLKHIVVQLLSDSPNGSPISAGVAHRIGVHLESFLVDAESGYRKSTGSAPTSPETNRQGTPRGKQVSPEGEKTDDCNCLFALEILKEVAKTNIVFPKTFTASLLALLTAVIKKHNTAASTKQKQGGVSFVPQAGTSSIRQMYHTPVSGILAEASSSEGSKPPTGTGRGVAMNGPYPSKELKEFDQSLRSAVIILEILGRSDAVYTFTQSRKTLLQSLSSILDSSNSVHLLMAAVRIVGRWLMFDESGCPLTVKERNSFLWKIASFDFNGLSDAVSQPLADLVSHYVVRLLAGKLVPGSQQPSDRTEPAPKASHQKSSDSDDIILGRSLAACLLTANHSLRDMLLGLFVAQTSLPGEERQLQNSDHEEIPVRAPVELLWQLFHSDFEGLGGRHWVVLFVDLLLANVRLKTRESERGVEVTGRKCFIPMAKVGPNSGLSDDEGAFSDYESFCVTMMSDMSNLLSGGHNVRTALRRLAHGDVGLCQELFQVLLPAAWNTAPCDGIRLSLVPSMESLLSRPFHSQFLRNGSMRDDHRSSNVIRSFLNGVAKLNPLPALDVDLLVLLAESYNCWYEVLTILEEHFLVLSSRTLSQAGRGLKDKISLAMRHCYRHLGESNVWVSLALESCNLPETTRAASFDVHGRIGEALEAYTGLVELVESSAGTSPTDFEMSMIEERWVELNREQCQTAVVAEYASASENSGLMLESAWKQQDWDRVRSLCTSPALVAAVESGEPGVKMCETLLAVADGKLHDVENLHAQTAQLCLYKWQLLPELSSASLAHGWLLRFFHRLVEIRESSQIMVETSNHSNGKTLPDLKNLLNAWRHRLPNDYEELVVWDEVCTWRSHMFSAITSNFSWCEPTTLASLHDRPWTAIRMSMAARKQGMRQTALLLLNKLTDSRAMDVSDAYLKLREQILSYNNPENELERTGGLNLINTTNLSFFDAQQKGELFRLKAMFLSSLRRTSKSNQAYCHSVQICPTHSKAWVSWGGLCSSLGTITEKQAEQMASKGGTAQESSKESRAASAKKVAQYLAQAMGCYLEAVQIDAHEKARIHLPKCLWMLTKDGMTPGVLCQTLENRGTNLPPWVWLPWIPQLLTGLCRIEGRAIKAILTSLVKAYPQAVYYSLRAFYLERRDVERAKGLSSSGKHMASVAYAEEMMSTLRRSHASLWSSLEAILEELIVKFRPSYEEELLTTITALLERAESHLEKQSVPDKTSIEQEEEMVATWSKTLSRIAAKFFRADNPTSPNRRDERIKRTIEFKRKYKADFEHDFKVSASESHASPPDQQQPFSLSEYVARLQKWKLKLETQVACTPAALPLIESSQSLAMFTGDIPDLWPGACDTRYLKSDLDRSQEEDEDPGRSQSSTSSSAAIARKAAQNAALAAANAAACEGVGGEYGGGSASIEIPGQYCPNSSTSADVRPSPELHAKLYRFEPFVEVLRRNDQLVRRVAMIGSDGQTYRFLLQFAIPYWTRTDERTAQTSYIVDKFLRQNVMCARNHLSTQPSAAIPVAQRLRMTLDPDSRIALDEVFKDTPRGKGSQLEHLQDYFSREVAAKLRNKTTHESSAEEQERAEKEARMEVFGAMCKLKVDSHMFLRHMQSVLDGPEKFFQFRRAFAGQLASNSLLQYVFAVAERTPQRFVVLQANARVLSPDFRVSYSSQGFIESPVVPFRMTPNVEALLGKPYLEGRYIRSFAMVADAVREHKDEFDPILRLLMRDDILAWYSKSLAKTDAKTQELERQLIERVSKNVSTLHARFAECAPNTRESPEPIDARVRVLCKAATSPENLSMMPASFHAWM